MAAWLPLGHAVHPLHAAKYLWRSNFESLLVKIGIVNKMMEVLFFEFLCLWPFPAALSCVGVPLLFVDGVHSVLKFGSSPALPDDASRRPLLHFPSPPVHTTDCSPSLNVQLVLCQLTPCRHLCVCEFSGVQIKQLKSMCLWTWLHPGLIAFLPVSAHCEGVESMSVHVIFHAHVHGHSHAAAAFILVEALVSLCLCGGIVYFFCAVNSSVHCCEIARAES